MIKVGTIVWVDGSASLGKVITHYNAWRTTVGAEQTLHVVHYIDNNTGLLMVCPDFDRCNHDRTCPIHGVNAWEDRLRPVSQDDIGVLIAEGILKERTVYAMPLKSKSRDRKGQPCK